MPNGYSIMDSPHLMCPSLYVYSRDKIKLHIKNTHLKLLGFNPFITDDKFWCPSGKTF